MRLRWDGIIARLSYRFNFLAIRGRPEGGIGSLVETLMTITAMDERRARSWVASVLDVPHERVAAMHRQWRTRNRTDNP